MIKKVLFALTISSFLSGCVGDTESKITCDSGFTTNWSDRAYSSEGGKISWENGSGWRTYKMIPGEQCYLEKRYK